MPTLHLLQPDHERADPVAIWAPFPELHHIAQQVMDVAKTISRDVVVIVAEELVRLRFASGDKMHQEISLSAILTRLEQHREEVGLE